MGIVVSAFPGIGKTWAHNNLNINSIDSDSSCYSWVTINGTKIRNKDFPHNYIYKIKKLTLAHDFVFVSSHAEVREALKLNGIYFYLLFPAICAKDEYINRYIMRGSNRDFIKLLSSNWHTWINELQNETLCSLIEISADKYLSDYLYMLKGV